MKGELMIRAIKTPRTIWDEMIQAITDRLTKGSLDKPIVFALYTKEHDHYEIVDYREITTVMVKGDYPNGEYDYCYPGIKKQGFYPHKGTGKWFSGTLVVGDGTELEEGDKQWMIRDQMDFRIKMDADPQGRLSWKAYFINFPIVSVEFQ
jgi:hypothetical protein